ncbi:MAG: hypothetical protein VYA55_04565 [Pseudomonadota bacterium]|nr:hypothetical protein [Pseudomonadota bacterium]
MKTLIALTTAGILLSGCSSSVVDPQDDPIVTDLTGKPVEYVEKKLGLPNKRDETRSGSMVWVYLDRQKGMSAKECSVTLSIRNKVIENVVVKSDDQSLFSIMSSSCSRIRKDLGLTS